MNVPYANMLHDASFAGALSELETMLQRVDTLRERLEQVGEVGKWSPKEVFGHTIDSALNNLQRFVRAQIPEHLEGGVLILPGYAQDSWVECSKYNHRNVSELLQLWKSLNTHILFLLDGIAPESLNVPCVIGGGAPLSLEDVIVSYVGHIKHHLLQLGF